MSITVATNLDYLIDSLRLHLGDTNPLSYRYLDEWLRTAIVLSVKNLQRWWNYKYLIDDITYDISRNPHTIFLFESPPILEHGDERPVILQAAIIIKQGALENSAWDFGSWKDYEISYSNIESSKSRDSSLKRDIDELSLYLKPPTKRLMWADKRSLPGYKENQYEREITDP